MELLKYKLMMLIVEHEHKFNVPFYTTKKMSYHLVWRWARRPPCVWLFARCCFGEQEQELRRWCPERDQFVPSQYDLAQKTSFFC